MSYHFLTLYLLSGGHSKGTTMKKYMVPALKKHPLFCFVAKVMTVTTHTVRTPGKLRSPN